MKCNVSAADTIFCLKIAFDENFNPYSPGVLLEVENMNVFHDNATSV